MLREINENYITNRLICLITFIIILLIFYWKIYVEIIGYGILYFLPTIIAVNVGWRGDLIFVINLFFGWIFVWIILNII